jgi:hypothetical protein
MERCLSQSKKMTLKKNQYVYNFNILNDYVDDWDNIQSQVQEHTKKH